MVYCQNCSKEVKPNSSYGWQLWVIGIATWVIAGLIIDSYGYSGAWGFVIALFVARLFANRFRIKKCPECSQPLEKRVKITPIEEPSTIEVNEDQSENKKQRDMAQLEKLWTKSEKDTPLPEEAKKVIEEGGSPLQAFKAGKRAIGKPDTLLGNFKHGLKEGLEESENKDA